MRVDEFDFQLPEDRIALRPAQPRDAARLLVVPSNPLDGLADRRVRELPDIIAPGDLLVVNDTKVIPARLQGLRVRGEAVAHIEATLHMREGPDRWAAFVRPAKRLAVGERIRFGETSEGSACLLGHLDAVVEEKRDAGEVLLRFEFHGPALDEAIAGVGRMPLPPYIAAKRAEDAADLSDYQTLFAREEGAVAAPTAGLHFTPALLAALEKRGVEVAKVTLHVGAGTFLPVKADDTADHRMHAELGHVSVEAAAAINEARMRGSRVVSVGTTSLRLLEAAAGDDGVLRAWTGATSIFITPGYRFKVVDVLMTNFHLPRSTLFMLVSAFSGLGRMRQAYAHAIASGYRFYSYGDATLLFRAEPETSP
jgi:S-adenosylmethionine:tRNA ribosyltransferase-isomerase